MESNTKDGDDLAVKLDDRDLAKRLTDSLKVSVPLDEVENLVETFQTHVDAETIVREDVREISRELDKAVRTAMHIMQRVHLEGTNDEICKTLGKAAEELIASTVVPILGQIQNKIPAIEFYRYNDMLRNSMVRTVLAVVLSRFLQNLEFSTISIVANALKLDTIKTKAESCSFFLEWEVYLEGLLSIGQELSRLGKNAVILDNYTLAERIHNIISTLSYGFSGLNFKNDSLRRRYDSLKYDVRTIEEVIYDLKMLRK